MWMFGQLPAEYWTEANSWRMSIVEQKCLHVIEYSQRQNQSTLVFLRSMLKFSKHYH